MQEASKAMEKQERDEREAAIIEQRKSRADYSDNFFIELTMDSLDAIFERSQKEYQDFKAFFKIDDATEEHIYSIKNLKPHRLRSEFLEHCYLSGVVEAEVKLYNDLLSKRIRDI